MNRFGNIYHMLSLLSLDVVAGAVVCALFFSRIFSAPASTPVLAALALTVWIIYTADHLRDAWAMAGVAVTDRHRFHQKHFLLLSACLGMALAAALLILWQVPAGIVRPGMLLGVPVVAYLAFQRYLSSGKEFIVATLYTAGILLPSLALSPGNVENETVLLMVLFGITALVNLLLFSLLDVKHDMAQGQTSFATRFGIGMTVKSIAVLLVVNVLLCAWMVFLNFRASVIFLMMNMMLTVLLLMRGRAGSAHVHRLLGDAVFLLPLLYLL